MKQIELNQWAFRSQMGVAEVMRTLREIPKKHVALLKAQEFLAWNFGTLHEHHDTLLGHAPDWVRENAERLLDYDAGPNGFTAGLAFAPLASFQLAA
jgi:hypothetical protein